jgi:hypothetical protein
VVFRLEGRWRREHLEQDVGEVLSKHVGSSGGERVFAIHRFLVFDTDRDDVA